MPNNKYTDDLFTYAVEQKPIEFNTTLNNAFLDKIHTALEHKKEEIARNFYGYEGQENSPGEAEEHGEES
jgi:hypothetical protein